MRRQELRRISLLVRSVIERRVRAAFEANPQRDLGDPEDLCGSCGLAAWALWRTLPGTTLVIGKWNAITHCWVELDGHIIDITATQFNFKSPARILVKDGKPAAKYEVESTNQKADAELSTWYLGEWRQELEALLESEGLLGKS